MQFESIFFLNKKYIFSNESELVVYVCLYKSDIEGVLTG